MPGYMSNWQKTEKGRAHKARNRQRVKDLVRKSAEDIGVCQTCGGARSDHPLEWHHRDPKTKKFRVSQAHTLVGARGALAEIAKCDLLCKPCHMEAHGKRVLA